MYDNIFLEKGVYMKKILMLVLVFSVALCPVGAKDYVKMQLKEMKHAQKYGTTQKVLQNQHIQMAQKISKTEIKDPKIMKFGNYETVSQADYNKKLKSDEKKYGDIKKNLAKSASKHYKTQADAADFYKVYRVAEKLIRANKLDYINWRIEIYKDSVNPNAFSTNTNYIALSTSIIDNFGDNDDAMALIIGHEMGHALLGHQERTARLTKKMQDQKILAKRGNYVSAAAYLGMRQKYRTDSKNMEYAADVEGAKLALHAGYNLDSGSEVISYISSLPRMYEWQSDHPNPVKRLQNLQENAKYFPAEWDEIGKVNIYNSEPMPARLSSDRRSMVISAPLEKLNAKSYYAPETMEEVYARFGYMYYINGEFSKSINSFEELFKLDKTNAPAYLYASYASEYLYKQTNDSKYLKQAKEFAQKAQSLDSKNNYIKEQVNSL